MVNKIIQKTTKPSTEIKRKDIGIRTQRHAGDFSDKCLHISALRAIVITIDTVIAL